MLYFNNLGKKLLYLSNKHPNKIALIIESVSFTFKDVIERSNQISNWLIKNDINNEDRVCISSEKTFNNFCIMIASLNIGASYTFYDRKSPLTRLKKIFKVLEVNIIFYIDPLFEFKNKKIKIYNSDLLKKEFIKHFLEQTKDLKINGDFRCEIGYRYLKNNSKWLLS